MSLSKTEIDKIAHLARLSIEADNLALYATQLSDIIDFVSQMDRVDTTDILPLSHPLDLTARLRPDVVSEENLREQFQNIAPKVEAGLYLVPKVIE